MLDPHFSGLLVSLHPEVLFATQAFVEPPPVPVQETCRAQSAASLRYLAMSGRVVWYGICQYLSLSLLVCRDLCVRLVMVGRVLICEWRDMIHGLSDYTCSVAHGTFMKHRCNLANLHVHPS